MQVYQSLGLGFVLQRSDGRPDVVATRTVVGLNDACMAEALGVLHTLDWIEEAGWFNVQIESDANLVVDGINVIGVKWVENV